MDYLKLIKVATRMLMDVIAVFEKKETVYEVGCKCKDAETATALAKILSSTLEEMPVEVKTKDDTIVVIKPLIRPSSPEASSPQHPLSQTPLPPSPPSLSGQQSPSSS